MKFLTRRHDYKVEYSKTQARKMLLEDRRVDKVRCWPKKMVIQTVPIKPTDTGFDKLILVPLGVYIITITESKKQLNIMIERKGKSVGSRYHYHIDREWTPSNGYDDINIICWGNLEESISIIRRNKDWFWLAKLALDLVWDFKKERNGCSIDLIKILIKLQLAYAGKDKQVRKRLREIYMKIAEKERYLPRYYYSNQEIIYILNKRR